MAAVARLVAIAGVLVGSGAASAADMNYSAESRGVSSDSSQSWVSVQINNPTAGSIPSELVFRGYAGDQSGQITVEVPPVPANSSRTINIPLQPISADTATYKEPRSMPGTLAIPSRYSYSGDPTRRAYVLVTPELNQLTNAELDAFSRAYVPSDTYTAFGMRSGTSGSSTTAPLSAQERIITQMSASELAENWLCYLPLKSVFVSETLEKQITPAQKQALNTWIQLGGNLVYYDATTSEVAQMGRGTIVRTAKNPVRDLSHPLSDKFGDAMAVVDNWDSHAMPYAVANRQNRVGLFILITLFMALVGPLNYVYCASKGDIRRLLKTVPLVSAGFCGLIGAYFLFTDGFTRKGGSISITTLDEERDAAMTFARHSVISGLYPSGGFHFSTETLFRPSRVADSGAELRLDRELVLVRGLFRPKMPFNYTTVTPRTTRERLILDDALKSARNGFELPLARVAVFDGENYYEGGAGAPGAEITLKRLYPEAVQLPKPDTSFDGAIPRSQEQITAETLARIIARGRLTDEEAEYIIQQVQTVADGLGFTSGTVYAVQFDGVPPGVEPGIKITQGKNLHILYGRAAGETAK